MTDQVAAYKAEPTCGEPGCGRPYSDPLHGAAYDVPQTRRVAWPSRARWPKFGCPVCGVGVWALRRHLKVWHGA